MVEGWITNIKQNPPPENEMVEIKGTGFCGEWVTKAYRKDYKKGSTKKQLRRKWRWVHGVHTFDDVVEAWRPITDAT